MFKTQGNKQSLAQQLRNKFLFHKDGEKQKQRNDNRRLPRHMTPDDDVITQQTLKEKMTPASNEYINSYSQFFLEHSIAAEFNHLKKTRLPGVYVIPSCNNPLVWFGVIFIRQGYYQGGVFRFTLTIPTNYPDGDCPSVRFTPPVFHPFIDATNGNLDMERGFSVWRPNVNHIWQILLYLRRMFYKFDSKDPINLQAAELYESDKDGFREKVQNAIDEINNTLYEDVDDDDAHAIRFRAWDEETHGSIKDSIIQPKMDADESQEDDFSKPKLSGLSFIEPGTSLVFSKER